MVSVGRRSTGHVVSVPARCTSVEWFLKFARNGDFESQYTGLELIDQLEIVTVHGKDQVELMKIFALELPGAQPGDVYTKARYLL